MTTRAHESTQGLTTSWVDSENSVSSTNYIQPGRSKYLFFASLQVLPHSRHPPHLNCSVTTCTSSRRLLSMSTPLVSLSRRCSGSRLPRAGQRVGGRAARNLSTCASTLCPPSASAGVEVYPGGLSTTSRSPSSYRTLRHGRLCSEQCEEAEAAYCPPYICMCMHMHINVRVYIVLMCTCVRR